METGFSTERGKEMTKPSIKILKDSAEKWEVELSGGSIKNAISSLQEFFVDSYGEDELAKCPVCGNMGPETDKDGALVEACPFCGQRFSGEAEEQPAPKKAATKEDETTPRVAKKKRGRPPKNAEPEEVYIATPEQKKELLATVARINELRQSMAENAWEIGQSLVEINDKSLWRGIGYDSFFAYCAAELDFSRAMAYKYMLCSRSFERDEFQLLGVKKGELIASAPDRHKPLLLKKAKKNASFSELRSQLNKLEGKTSGTRGPKGGMTLLGRVKEGNVDVPWLSARSHSAITRAGIKGRYALIQLTEEIEVVLVPTENELGMVATFRKIGEGEATQQTDPDAE